MKTKLSRFAAVLAAAALLVTAISCKTPEDATKEAAATPVITVADNSVTITCATEGATIYYTKDGSDPTADSSVYSSPIALTETVTVKAFAAADGYDDSETAEKECTYVAPVAATPVITDEDNKVTITCETEDAVIYYTTDGSAPTAESTKYEAPFDVTATVTVKAVATKEGYTDSEVASAEVEYVAPGTVGTPKITQDGNTVTITCATTGATIYYTIDGTAPTTKSTKYTAAITLTETVTIKAIAVADGYTTSNVASKECVYTAAVVATPVIGDVTSNTVAITCATEGATIYYTTDGTTPTTSSTVYKDSITFYVNSTIKAIAVKSGYTNSEVSSKDVEASYSISSYPISIPVNGTNNYQVILSDVLPDDYSAKAGDIFKINFSGKSDTDLTNLQTFIVDNAADTGNGWGWHLISDYKSFAESVSADTDFDYSVTFTITEDATGTGAGSHKIAIYYDLSVGKEAIIYKQGTDLSAIDTSKVTLVEDKTYEFTTGDSEPWTNAGKYGAQTVIHDWTGESFSCDDYSSITIEYEVFEGSQGLQLIVNSSTGGTGWQTADDWSNKGSATIDLTAFKGKEFHWIAIATYLADASTAGSIKVNKIYLTKASE